MSDITDAGPRLKAMNDAMEIARLRLTDAEREAVERAVEHLQNSGWGTAVLRGLLERLGGEHD